MKCLIFLAITFSVISTHGQQGYADSLRVYLDDYITKHEVVKSQDKNLFRFYPANEDYRITAKFVPATNANWFSMETSGSVKKTHRVYGSVHFLIGDTTVALNVYQSQNLLTLDQYKDYLFLPFTDLTSGDETYTAGRYLDLKMSDIINGQIALDFNKAYNPYCAYVSGKYNCPIPPKENRLAVAIRAGEKTFAASATGTVK